MPGKLFPRQRSGQPIAARTLNLPIAEIERQSKLSASAPLKLSDLPGGPAVADASETPFIIKITSGTDPGPFAWTRQYSASAGTLTNATQAGTTSIDPAYNSVSGVTLTLPQYGWAWREADGTLYFSAASC